MGARKKVIVLGVGIVISFVALILVINGSHSMIDSHQNLSANNGPEVGNQHTENPAGNSTNFTTSTAPLTTSTLVHPIQSANNNGTEQQQQGRATTILNTSTGQSVDLAALFPSMQDLGSGWRTGNVSIVPNHYDHDRSSIGYGLVKGYVNLMGGIQEIVVEIYPFNNSDFANGAKTKIISQDDALGVYTELPLDNVNAACYGRAFSNGLLLHVACVKEDILYYIHAQTSGGLMKSDKLNDSVATITQIIASRVS